MKKMQSFLIMFYILDQCYDQSGKDEHLGGFLGMISPELWGDGCPIDQVVFNDWTEMSKPETMDRNNILDRIYSFLEYYEKEEGFAFPETKHWLLTMADEIIIEKACEKSHFMYQKYGYTD